MQGARKLLKFLFRFKCPKCEVSSFDAKAMQGHLLLCKKDLLEQKELVGLVEVEISREMTDIAMLPENDGVDQNSANDDFKFEDSKSEIPESNNDVSPNPVC